MSNYIQICGMIETPNDINVDDFIDSFLEWLEERNSCFGGSYFKADENGDEINTNEDDSFIAIDGGDMYESIVLKDKEINGLPTDRLKNFAKYMKDNDNGLGMESVR